MLLPPFGHFGMFPEPEREPERHSPYRDPLSPIDDRIVTARFERGINSMFEDAEAYTELVHSIMEGVFEIAVVQDESLAGADYDALLGDVYTWRSPSAIVELHSRLDMVTGVAPESLVLSGIRGRLARDLAYELGSNMADVQAGFVHIDVPELGTGVAGASRLYQTIELAGAAQVTATISDHADLREPYTGPQAVTTYAQLGTFLIRHQLLTAVD